MIDVDLFGIQDLGAALYGNGHLEVFLGDPSQPQQDVAQHDAGFFGFQQGHLELIAIDKPHLH